MGQEEAGAIDFKMTYASSNLISGDVNFYSVNPFKMNYTTGNYTYKPLPDTVSAPMNKAKPLIQKQGVEIPNLDTFVVNEGDHYVIDGSLPLLNFKWYN